MINQLIYTKKGSPKQAPVRPLSAQSMARRFSKLRGPRRHEPQPMEVEDARLEPLTRVKGSSEDHQFAKTYSRRGQHVSEGKMPAEPMEEDNGGKSDEEETRMSLEFSRDRRDIARGKMPVEVVEEENDSESDEEESKVSRKPLRKKKIFSKEELLPIFLARGFSGTRYPHRETMQELGISRDVEFLFEMSYLATFMSFKVEAYREETCHFLASLAVHFYEDEPEYRSDGGLGFITFSVRDKDYALTIQELDTLFGFPSGTDTCQDFDKNELKALWETIGGKGEYSSARSKGAQIRSPVLRYFHKSIASTLFARQVTGTINEGEMQLIDMALQGILDSTRDGRPITGDRSNTGLIFVLLDQLLYYREWAVKMHRKGTKGEISIGGIVTPILVACNVDLVSQPDEPRWIDIPSLKRARFLEREKVNGHHLYKFFHPEVGNSNIILPCTELTAIRTGANIDFWPPTSILYDPSAESPQQAQHIPDDEEQESFYFEDISTSTQSKSLEGAHKQIGILQKWNKFQDKTIKALKNSVKDLTNTVKEMKVQIKRLQRKRSSLPSNRSSHEPQILRRSGSLHTAPRQSDHMEPPRASSYEPREQKRKARRPKMEESTSSSFRLEHTLEPTYSSLALESAYSRLTLEPAYTRESMEDSTTSYFTQL